MLSSTAGGGGGGGQDYGGDIRGESILGSHLQLTWKLKIIGLGILW